MTEGQRGNTEAAAELSAGALLDATDRALIDMFLTNRLDRKERAMVETRIVADPEFRREVELTEALRAGMRELAKQGQIAPLLAPPVSFWNRPPVAVAAFVMAGLLAVNSLLLYQRLDQTEQSSVAATNRPAESTLADPTRTEALRFEQTRGAEDTPDVSWHRSSLPTLLELQFDVGLDPAPSYQVTIERLTPGRHASMLIVSHISINTDREITFAMHSALLEPGDYRVRLEPQPTSDQDYQPVAYSLRVAD